MWKWSLGTLSLGILLCAVNADAFLLPNVSGDQAGTLPQRRFLLAVPTYFGSVGNQYSLTRQSKPLKENLSKSLGWREMVQADATQGPALQGLLESNGVNLDASAGGFTGDFSSRFQAYVPIVGVGIFDELSLFVALPVIRLQAEMRAAYQASPEARALVQRLRDSGQVAAADEMADRLNHGFTDRMNELGYQYEESIDRVEIGDLRVLLPWTVLKRDRLLLSLQPALSIPTGRSLDPNSLIPFYAGTGRWTVGTKAITQWEFVNGFFLVGSVGAHFPFPTTQARRIPVDSNDLLPADSESAVRIEDGWLTEAQLDVKWQFSRSWSVRTGVQSQHRFASRHSGALYAGERYALLDRASEESLQSWSLNLEFFSLKAFLDGDFLFPFQVIAGVGVPFSGMGTLSDPVFAIQGSLFF